ncbi:Angiopoietin-1 [Mizuhopecten yessoensis]|uniref:Angiopoietin-1 n=1 Tax=Mizuhopecten yessoensis TaxID=6573 RepID=A0A210Q746_MIZYE|nr:Angiopoietin-1 [Mizuhopecten yessoensis]
MATAYCDMDTLGGGWTVIQNRFNGSRDFYKTWEEYKTGFGNPNGEYWLGNDYIYTITSADTYELRIEMEYADSTKAYASYATFSLSSESDS